ncbi:MAG TPA: transposase [Gammaproteobacteria bacterium]|nr:transposase [Gammaproteobacteria bacterium]
MYYNTYRIQSSRYPGYNYASEGFYFVTWCVKEMTCVLSKIVNDEVKLFSMGSIVEEEILKTEKVRRGVLIDSHVIMPNHVHCIFHIACRDAPLGRLESTEREENENTPLQKEDAPTARLYRSSIGSIVNQIKSQSTKRICQSHDNAFQWQSRFYDHIIRNDDDLEKHRLYIGINSVKWPQDEYFIV